LYNTGMHNIRRVMKSLEISSITAPEGLGGFQEVEVLRFRDNGTGWW